MSSQLAELGYAPEDIDFMAMSHHHMDHTGNANAFADSTWIVQQADYTAMFSDASTGIAESYLALKDAKRISPSDSDHDVFGDGIVIVKRAPGHTPGHQTLFLNLQTFGPLLLLGDLYHVAEQTQKDRVSTFEFDADLTRDTRKSVEAFIARSRAQTWIQHDLRTFAMLRKSPAYYD